ncbi:phage tail termination protein [Xenorhabdus bovienii]|uniref:phage tail termination protein n=1 Tax=Xenorhabdus bovienii TaxID=40576 RepID=UPI003DA60EDC
MSTFEQFRHYLAMAGLIDGFTVQMVTWIEQKGDGGKAQYMVFQPSGGTGRLDDLSADDNVQVVLVSGQNDPQPVIQRAQEILNYVASHPDDDCLNAVFNLGGMPTPIPTQENRYIIRLLFRCTS